MAVRKTRTSRDRTTKTWQEREKTVNSVEHDVLQRIAMTVTELRCRRGLTLAELAARAGMKEHRLEQVEAAVDGVLRIDDLTKLAMALRVPVVTLVRRHVKEH
jgi:ribosome-binding protein aMBF1 (putative translation factor)